MKIIWGLRARKVTRVMNCGCLPGFPGENHKQLLNAVVYWEGLAGGDFETSQKQDWRLQKVVIRHWTGEDSEDCCLAYLALFGERFLFSSHLQFALSL